MRRTLSIWPAVCLLLVWGPGMQLAQWGVGLGVVDRFAVLGSDQARAAVLNASQCYDIWRNQIEASMFVLRTHWGLHIGVQKCVRSRFGVFPRQPHTTRCLTPRCIQRTTHSPVTRPVAPTPGSQTPLPLPSLPLAGRVTQTTWQSTFQMSRLRSSRRPLRSLTKMVMVSCSPCVVSSQQLPREGAWMTRHKQDGHARAWPGRRRVD